MGFTVLVCMCDLLREDKELLLTVLLIVYLLKSAFLPITRRSFLLKQAHWLMVKDY